MDLPIFSTMLMDGKLSTPTRVLAYFLTPLAFLLLLPVLLLFVAGFYLLALFEGLRSLLAMMLGKADSPETSTQKPHFLETSVTVKPPREDESTSVP